MNKKRKTNIIDDDLYDWDDSYLDNSRGGLLAKLVRRKNQRKPGGGLLFGRNDNNEQQFVVNFLSDGASSNQDAQVVPSKNNQAETNGSSASISPISFTKVTCSTPFPNVRLQEDRVRANINNNPQIHIDVDETPKNCFAATGGCGEPHVSQRNAKKSPRVLLKRIEKSLNVQKEQQPVNVLKSVNRSTTSTKYTPKSMDVESPQNVDEDTGSTGTDIPKSTGHKKKQNSVYSRSMDLESPLEQPVPCDNENVVAQELERSRCDLPKENVYPEDQQSQVSNQSVNNRTKKSTATSHVENNNKEPHIPNDKPSKLPQNKSESNLNKRDIRDNPEVGQAKQINDISDQIMSDESDPGIEIVPEKSKLKSQKNSLVEQNRPSKLLRSIAEVRRSKHFDDDSTSSDEMETEVTNRKRLKSKQLSNSNISTSHQRNGLYSRSKNGPTETIRQSISDISKNTNNAIEQPQNKNRCVIDSEESSSASDQFTIDVNTKKRKHNSNLSAKSRRLSSSPSFGEDPSDVACDENVQHIRTPSRSPLKTAEGKPVGQRETRKNSKVTPIMSDESETDMEACNGKPSKKVSQKNSRVEKNRTSKSFRSEDQKNKELDGYSTTSSDEMETTNRKRLKSHPRPNTKLSASHQQCQKSVSSIRMELESPLEQLELVITNENVNTETLHRSRTKPATRNMKHQNQSKQRSHILEVDLSTSDDEEPMITNENVNTETLHRSRTKPETRNMKHQNQSKQRGHILEVDLSTSDDEEPMITNENVNTETLHRSRKKPETRNMKHQNQSKQKSRILEVDLSLSDDSETEILTQPTDKQHSNSNDESLSDHSLSKSKASPVSLIITHRLSFSSSNSDQSEQTKQKNNTREISRNNNSKLSLQNKLPPIQQSTLSSETGQVSNETNRFRQSSTRLSVTNEPQTSPMVVMHATQPPCTSIIRNDEICESIVISSGDEDDNVHDTNNKSFGRPRMQDIKEIGSSCEDLNVNNIDMVLAKSIIGFQNSQISNNWKSFKSPKLIKYRNAKRTNGKIQDTHKDPNSKSTTITTAEYNDMQKELTERLSQNSTLSSGRRRRLYSKKSFQQEVMMDAENEDISSNNPQPSSLTRESYRKSKNERESRTMKKKSLPKNKSKESMPLNKSAVQPSTTVTVEAEIHNSCDDNNEIADEPRGISDRSTITSKRVHQQSLQKNNTAECIENVTVDRSPPDAELMPPPKPPKKGAKVGRKKKQLGDLLITSATMMDGVRKSSRERKPPQTYWTAKREDAVFLTIEEYASLTGSKMNKKKTNVIHELRSKRLEPVREEITNIGNDSHTETDQATVDEGIQCCLLNSENSNCTYISSEDDSDNDAPIMLHSKNTLNNCVIHRGVNYKQHGAIKKGFQPFSSIIFFRMPPHMEEVFEHVTDIDMLFTVTHGKVTVFFENNEVILSHHDSILMKANYTYKFLNRESKYVDAFLQKINPIVQEN